MRHFRLLLLVSLFALTGLPCWGQQSTACKVHFKVIESDRRIPGSPIEKLTETQEKWLREKEPQKYPAVCFDPAKAMYAVIWTEAQETITNRRPHIEANVGVNDGVTGSTVTYSEETSTRSVTHISVAKIGADGSLEDPPVFVDKDPAQAKKSSSSAAGLEHGVKFLNTLGKK